MKSKKVKRIVTTITLVALFIGYGPFTSVFSMYAAGGSAPTATEQSADSETVSQEQPATETPAADSGSSVTEDQSGDSSTEVNRAGDTNEDNDSNNRKAQNVPAADSEDKTETPTEGIWIDGDSTTYKTLTEAVDAASSGATIHMKGVFDADAVSNATVNKGITLDVSGSTTITGSGKKGFTLSDGATLTTSGSLTMSGFTDAITVNSGSVISDGTYDISDVNNGFVLNGTGKIEGSSQSALNMTVTAKKNQVGFATNNRTDASADIDDKLPNFVRATVIVRGGRVDGWTYRAVVSDNAHVELNDIWLFNSASDPILIKNHSYFKISGRFNQNSWSGGHVLGVYQDQPVKFVDSTVVVDGSRINVAGGQPLYVDNSDLTIQNSPDGGVNINYGQSVYFKDSVLRSKNVTGALIAAGYKNQSNLYFRGSSAVETNAVSQGDAIGVNGSFVVTGGTFKTYIASSYSSNQTPTNGAENGNEKLTLFQLSDPSVTELSPINANGDTYSYSVAKANDDGTKRVWGT